MSIKQSPGKGLFNDHLSNLRSKTALRIINQPALKHALKQH